MPSPGLQRWRRILCLMPRHHLVPQMHLNRFADDRQQLVVVPRDDRDAPFRSSVRKAAAEVGFYAIPTDDLEAHAREGHDPEAVERALSLLEGSAAGAIDRILAGDFPPCDLTHRMYLSSFIALQQTRGWRFRRDFAEMARLTAPAFIRANISAERVREVLIAQGQPAEPVDVKAMFERLTGPDGPKPVVRQGIYVQHAIRHALEDIAPTIFLRSWRLLTFPRPCLLTSDEPVALPSIEARGPANVPQLWLPLDRTHALELNLNGSEQVVMAPLSKAAKINRLVASQAERWIFHHPDDAPLQGFELTSRMRLVERIAPLVEAGLVVGEARGLVRAPIDPG